MVVATNSRQKTFTQSKKHSHKAMIEKKPDTVLVYPADLANAYSDYMLITHDKKPLEGTLVPEDIYIRYEQDNELLFIDVRMFAWIHEKETLKAWRRLQQYCGPVQKRLASGSGKSVPPVWTVCFDTAETPRERQPSIKRKGRPLLASPPRHKAEVSAKLALSMTAIMDKLRALETQYRNHPMLAEIKPLLVGAKENLAEANLALGKKKTPGRPRKMPVPKDERVHLGALDRFIRDSAPSMHRILKRWVVVDGKQKWQDKDMRPRIDGADWLGRYEEITNAVTGHTKKMLYIPVAVLNGVPELKDYAKEERYVGKTSKHIGGITCYCAKFNLGSM